MERVYEQNCFQVHLHDVIFFFKWQKTCIWLLYMFKVCFIDVQNTVFNVSAQTILQNIIYVKAARSPLHGSSFAAVSVNALCFEKGSIWQGFTDQARRGSQPPAAG